MIKIDFEFETNYGVFKDALVLPENHTLSTEDIENIKLERLNRFITVIETPPSAAVVAEQEYIEIDGIKYLKAE